MNQEDMKKRTKRFALAVIGLCRRMPDSCECSLIRGQLFRSGTSVGSNYRAACRGRSRADFIAKLGIVLEESDETLFWLEILLEAGLIQPEQLLPLMQEADEIVAILVATLKTAKR